MLRQWFSFLAPYAWPAAALAVISLHFWFPVSTSGLAHDTYSPSAEGHKAFYRLVAQQPESLAVSRNHKPLAAVLSSLPIGQTLCILSPERVPNAEEWSELAEWIRHGGVLLYSFRGDQPQDIPWLNVKYVPDASTHDSSKPQTALVKSEVLLWWSDGRLETSLGTPLVKHHDTLQAAKVPYGNGVAVFLAGSQPFSNQALTYGDNSVLALRLLDAGGMPEFVVFDESLNDSGTPKTVGILFDPILRPVTIQILILTVLFGWWRSRRFGPLTPSAVSARQNIVEHTDMVGNWYWKSQDGAAALKAYLRELSSRLRLKTFRGTEDRVLEPIARRGGRETADVRHDLQQAFQAVRKQRLDRRQAARLIRRLSLIRRDSQVTAARRKAPVSPDTL